MVFNWAALTLLLFSPVIPQSDGIRGFNINNIQVASGSSVVFPNLSENGKSQEIPLEMLLRMNDVADTGKFIENFLYSELDNTTLTKISSEINPEIVERSNHSITVCNGCRKKAQPILGERPQISCFVWIYAEYEMYQNNDISRKVVKAQMAVCKPELKTVSVKPETDYTLYYHPSCIRVERCGGCCAHNLLTCTPADSEILNVGVVLAEYKGGERLVYKDFKVVPVERHTKCKCDCKIQPENCTKSQVYNKDKCSCECTNTDAERKCNAEVKTKIWNKDRCLCLCREEYECSSGYYFDLVSCRCELQEGRRRPPQRPWIA